MSDTDISDEARAMMVAACEKWIDQWDWTSGAIITGWLVVVEATRPGASPIVSWATGNGAATAGDEGGLAGHRVLGLARQVEHELAAFEVRRYMESDE